MKVNSNNNINGKNNKYWVDKRSGAVARAHLLVFGNSFLLTGGS